MKYLVYTALCFVAALLFLPNTGSTEIRNLPLLILLVSLALLAVLIRFFKYVVLMLKTKRLLNKHGMKVIHSSFLPWSSCFRGRYSVSFEHEGKLIQIVLLSKKRSYQRYHFERIDLLEFYRANRLVFNSTRVRGATISNAVEVSRVGKQKIKWDRTAVIRIVLFDRCPSDITDSASRNTLIAKDRICASDTYLLDWNSLCEQLLKGATV